MNNDIAATQATATINKRISFVMFDLLWVGFGESGKGFNRAPASSDLWQSRCANMHRQKDLIQSLLQVRLNGRKQQCVWNIPSPAGKYQTKFDVGDKGFYIPETANSYTAKLVAQITGRLGINGQNLAA